MSQIKKDDSTDKKLGWTKQDQLLELHGKLHLEECDRKVVYAWMENERKINERTIINLRQETKQKRVALAESINADENVIKNVFAKKREEQLSLKRLTADKAVAEMDQKTCERVKTLNGLRFNRMAREQKLKDMGLELKQMMVETQNSEQLSSGQRVRGLENSLDKARMKFETARNIGNRYEIIVKKMREDSMTYAARLDTKEQAVLEVHQERKNLENMNLEAHQNRDLARTRLSKMERELYSARKERDNKLTSLKKDIESRHLEMTMGKVAKKTKQSFVSTFTDSQQEKMALMQAKIKSENQFKLLKYDALFSEIKHATGLTKLDDFVDRFDHQNDTLRRLMIRSAECQQLTTKLRREKASLAKRLLELKYSGEKRLSVGQSTLESMADECSEKKYISGELRDEMNVKGQLLLEVKTGLKTIFEKLIDIKIPSPAHNRLSGDVQADIGIISEKYDRLLAALGDRAFKIMDMPNMHEILEQQLGDDNIRVQLKKSSSSIESGFEYELHDTDEVPTSDDIKHNGHLLVESKLTPKQKKAKAKE